MLSILAERIHDGRFLRLLGHMLKAGYLEDWRFNATLSGTPQGGVATPPTQQITRGGFGACDRDAVSDGHAFGADEDLLDEQAEYALALGDRGGVGLVAQAAEEAL